MQTLSIGGRCCFCRSNSGPLGFSKMATMPTASIKLFDGRVGLTADSLVLLSVDLTKGSRAYLPDFGDILCIVISYP